MPESAKPRVAVIGLGSMGYGMATSLRRAGLEVTGCDVSADSVKRFVADGGKGAGTPAEAAKAADIVVSVVVNAAQTETILFGANGVAETLGQGSGVHLLRHHGPRRRAAAGQTVGSNRSGTTSTRRFPAVRSARRRANSRSWPPAVRRHFQKPVRRSMRWPQNFTSSATTPARARRSR